MRRDSSSIWGGTYSCTWILATWGGCNDLGERKTGAKSNKANGGAVADNIFPNWEQGWEQPSLRGLDMVKVPMCVPTLYLIFQPMTYALTTYSPTDFTSAEPRTDCLEAYHRDPNGDVPNQGGNGVTIRGANCVLQPDVNTATVSFVPAPLVAMLL